MSRAVSELIGGELASVNWQNFNPTPAAATTTNRQISTVTGNGLDAKVIDRALTHVTFSVDPQAQTYRTLIPHEARAGTGTEGSISRLVNVSVLNAALTLQGVPTVSAHGLGKE